MTKPFNNCILNIFGTGKQSCSGKQTFNEEECECRCPYEMKCSPPWRPSNLECSCVCDEKTCSGKQVFDKETCNCQCPNKIPGDSCGKSVMLLIEANYNLLIVGGSGVVRLFGGAFKNPN
jgi:hypothetical protein